MTNKRPEAWIMILTGITGIASGFFVLSTFESLQKNSTNRTALLLQWMVNHFGKTGTALMFIIIGSVILYSGWRKLRF